PKCFITSYSELIFISEKSLGLVLLPRGRGLPFSSTSISKKVFNILRLRLLPQRRGRVTSDTVDGDSKTSLISNDLSTIIELSKRNVLNSLTSVIILGCFLYLVLYFPLFSFNFSLSFNNCSIILCFFP